MNEDVESEEASGGRVRLTLNWAPGPAEVTGDGKEDKITYEFRRQGNGETMVMDLANALQTNVLVDRQEWRTPHLFRAGHLRRRNRHHRQLPG